MSLTLTIPTWKQVSDMLFLAVFYYASWVAPQYDWIIFGVVYWFGACVMARTVYRMGDTWISRGACSCTKCSCVKIANGKREHTSEYKSTLYMLCVVWPILFVWYVSEFLVKVGNAEKYKIETKGL